ncbi:MAG: hydroxyethylthiazole kinase [Rhodanobacteraceae bacterium]
MANRALVPNPIQPEQLGAALAALRERAPLVQCLTNIVVANFTANVLLAAGASPAMVDNPAEAGAFAGVASGILVNLGTPYPDTAAGMAAAVDGAESAGKPWVLDPVATGVLGWRTSLATGFLADHHPAIVRGNASEILALAGGAGGKGVESLETSEQALDAATALAIDHQTVVAVSGAVDHLTDGERLVRVGNGHPWLTRITGSGCALGALMAAFAAVVDDPLYAATAATATLTVAADVAAARSTGPGSFAVALIDSLAALEPPALVRAVRLG